MVYMDKSAAVGAPSGTVYFTNKEQAIIINKYEEFKEIVHDCYTLRMQEQLLQKLIISLPHHVGACLTIIKPVYSFISTRCFDVESCGMSEQAHLVKSSNYRPLFFIGLSDFLLSLICCSSTLTSEWVCMLYLFNVTVFSFILSAATLFFSQSWRIPSLPSDPLNLDPELDRVVFELRCYFLVKLIGLRVVRSYSKISISNITCY